MGTTWQENSLEHPPFAVAPEVGLLAGLAVWAARVAERGRRWVSAAGVRVRLRGACVLQGHERWTALSGDWCCMRCGKAERLEVPRFPARPPEGPRSGPFD